MKKKKKRVEMHFSTFAFDILVKLADRENDSEVQLFDEISVVFYLQCTGESCCIEKIK